MWSIVWYILVAASVAAYLGIEAMYFLYAALVFSLAGVVVSMLSSRRSFSRELEEGGETQESGVTLQGREQLEEEYHEAQRELEEARTELKRYRDGEMGYAQQYVLVSHSVETERTLSQVIIDKTETSTNELTDHVYSLANSSREVGEKIRKALSSIATEEGGLKDDTERLEGELEIIENLIVEFQKIRDGYTAEMETIEETMREVDSFTDTITDLAERTSVLAINASIEAARAGNAGKGFAVIASEVQKLAGNTKSIAEQINSTVENSVHKVKDSIEQYGGRIEKSVGQLEKSGKDHAELIEKLKPQIENVSQVVQESQELSESVTGDLNEVTVHLQYQDTVRQILEHMIGILEKVTEKGKELAGTPKEIDEEEVERLREEMRSIASSFFTTREEWDAFGHQLQESLEDGTAKKSEDDSNELAGDVTLF